MFLLDFWPFYQFGWTLFFLFMFCVGFWGILFFGTFVVPVWITVGYKELVNIKKGKANFDTEAIRSKKLYEQEGVELVYQRPAGQTTSHHGHH
jgi:hypothetical protein